MNLLTEVSWSKGARWNWWLLAVSVFESLL